MKDDYVYFMAVKLDKKSGKLVQGKHYKSIDKAKKKLGKLKRKNVSCFIMASKDGYKWDSYNEE